MKFKAGHEKLGGRQKGVLNRRTKFLHEVLEANGFSVIEKLIELLPKLDISMQASILLRLLPYLYPERKPLECFSGTGELISAEPDEAPPKPSGASPAQNPNPLAAAVQEIEERYGGRGRTGGLGDSK